MRLLLDCGICLMLFGGLLLASAEVDPVPGWYLVHAGGLVMLAIGGCAACWATKYARFRR